MWNQFDFREKKKSEFFVDEKKTRKKVSIVIRFNQKCWSGAIDMAADQKV